MARTSKRQDTALGLRSRSVITSADPSAPGYVENVDFAVSSLPGTILRTSDKNWKVLVSKRLDAGGAYERRVVKVDNRVNRIVTLEKSQFGSPPKNFYALAFKQPCFSPSFANETDDTVLMDIALKRLKSKMSNKSKQVNLLVPAAEIRELHGTIRALAYSGLDLARAFIDIKRTKGKSAAQFAAHAWLQWSFALAPTISEAKQISEAIDAEIQLSGGNAYTEYGAAKKEWHTTQVQRHRIGVSSSLDLVLPLKHELSYRYTCGFKTPLRAGNNYSASDSFGLKMGALVPTLWELTAFSWLVDYFSTVGDYLEDTFITETNQTFYCNVTKKYRCSGMYEWKDLPKKEDSPYHLGHTVYGKTPKIDWFYTSRTLLSQLPSRQLRFKSVDEIGKNAINKVLNLASILVGGKAFSNRIKK